MVKGQMVHFPEDLGEGQWMTYSELARIRGIGRESAVKLVQREKWRKLAGNDRDRTVRVLVPLEWLKPARNELQGTFPEAIGDAVPGVTSEVSPQISALQIAVEALKGENSALREQVERERSHADQAEVRASCAEADRRAADAERGQLVVMADGLRAERDRADLALAAERNRADVLREKVETLQGEFEAARIGRVEAEADAAELRQAETVRKGRGRWTRLKAAWRGE